MNRSYEAIIKRNMCMDMCMMCCCMCKNIEPLFSCIHMPVPEAGD